MSFFRLWRRAFPALLLAAAIGLAAQSPAAFDVASIKPQPWKGNGRVGVFVQGKTLSAEHVSLADLIEFAWNIRDIQLSGGPSWMRHGMLASSDLYQVIAKTEVDPAPPMDQFRLMVQTLLAERFHLQVHHVQKELPVYHLVVMKNGPKLKESAADAKFAMAIDATRDHGRLTRIKATHATIARLLGQIEHYAGKPVFDKTGLTGAYDFEFELAGEGLAAASPDGSASDVTGQSIFTVLQRELGLKLESGNAPFDTVVVDHAEKPVEN